MAGLFDYQFQLEKINKYQPPLQKLNKIIDWELFRKTIEEALQKDDRKSNAGRKSYDRVLMFKILILQRYYNLSDEQTEFQIKDRLSFLDFLGLQIGDDIPDEKTIWLFKEQLKAKDLSKKLFELFTSKLIANGIVAREGTIVDASFVNVPKQRNTREENRDIKAGAIPLEFAKKDKSGKRSKLSQKDIDARWTVKNSEKHFGYKDHISSDQKTKIITNYTVTPASTHDSQVIKDLINEDDKVLYADSAYKSKEIEEYLKDKNVKSKITKRAYRNKPLTNTEVKQNYKHSKTRVRVEHIFATLTSQMNNGLNLLSIGIDRIKSTIGLMNLTYNLVRYEQMVRLQQVKIV
jgi:IS5 family transposase